MKFKGTLVLIVLCALLLAVVLLIDKNGAKSDGPAITSGCSRWKRAN